MIKGTIKLPGDKSISHRAALFSALKDGPSYFTNFNPNDDCSATLNCLGKMGIKHSLDGTKLTVFGKKVTRWEKPSGSLDAGNSGTTARLISGLLSAQKFSTELIGDESLSKRPMKRIIEPLTLMGADIESAFGYLPLKFNPVKSLKGITYKLPVASAQVKSAVLLAGLYADGETKVIETVESRDHTERMLNLKKTKEIDHTIIYSSSDTLIPELSMEIPGDFSSAAFFLCAALMLPGSDIQISSVSLNPTRTGLLKVLELMGAKIDKIEQKSRPEPIGKLHAEYQALNNIEIPQRLVPNIIDEIPVLAILATQSEGRFILKNAKELRFKESDRISAITNNLKNLGVKVEEIEDGFIIDGPQKIVGGSVVTHNDHRIAMAFSIAGLLSKEVVKIDNPACASVSFPTFYSILKTIVK